MPNVTGFRTPTLLTIHFGWHGATVGATDEQDYEQKAKAFLEADITNTTILEHTRSRGDVVRYNPTTEEFAIASATGHIRTYYIPIPQLLAPTGTNSRITHTHQTNYDYYLYCCTQW